MNVRLKLDISCNYLHTFWNCHRTLTIKNSEVCKHYSQFMIYVRQLSSDYVCITQVKQINAAYYVDFLLANECSELAYVCCLNILT